MKKFIPIVVLFIVIIGGGYFLLQTPTSYDVSTENEKLVFKSEKRKSIEFNFRDLASEEMERSILNMPVQFNYSMVENEWASSNIYAGVIRLSGPGDPPLFIKISVFEIDTKNWEVKKYDVPTEDLFIGKVDINAKNKKLLYETISKFGDLNLNIYSYYDRNITKIVSYDRSIVTNYCKSNKETPVAINYLYHLLVAGCDQDRSLNPAWDGESLTYRDFITRENVIRQMN